MPEHQSIEWKSSWDDEYLKWVCGYANAYGGALYIGKEDNTGKIIGLKNSRKLLKDIPDKITQTMGIIADVNLLYESDKEYLEIIVEKYPSLISLRGKYYYRSGSTMRTITGAELDKALLKAHGRTWDSVALPRVTVDDLEQSAIRLFKDKAVKSNRLTAEDVDVDVEDRILMENLRLFEEGSLIRAAVLSFCSDPEKWFFGSYIKIGFFVTDADLRYHDEVHGPLIEQIDKTVTLVYTKYLKALIYYEGIQRVEKFMFPRAAFREILINAVIHKDYSSCNPIQISVYDDKIYIWNSGEMPANLSSTEKLFEKHSSIPYNPRLAGVFFKSGMIEAWGRSFEKIKIECDNYETPLPEYDITSDGVMVLCKPNDIYMRLLNGAIDPLVDTNDDRTTINSDKTADKISNKGGTADNTADKLSNNGDTADNTADNTHFDAIRFYLLEHGEINSATTSMLIGRAPRTAREILSKFAGEGALVSIGGNRNRRYKLP